MFSLCMELSTLGNTELIDISKIVGLKYNNYDFVDSKRICNCTASNCDQKCYAIYDLSKHLDCDTMVNFINSKKLTIKIYQHDLYKTHTDTKNEFVCTVMYESYGKSKSYRGETIQHCIWKAFYEIIKDMR